MARVYDIAVAALAVGVDRKWLDNLTSQHTVPGTDHFTRGVPRRLSMRTLITASIVRELNRELGIPISRGVELATIVMDTTGGAESAGDQQGRPTTASGLEGREAVVHVGSSIAVTVDVVKLERAIESRLLDAMETIVPRRRGRPPRKERRGTR
jgi:hypothetical protein